MRIPFGTLNRFMSRLPHFMRDNKFATTATGKLDKSLGEGMVHQTVVETGVEDALLIAARSEGGYYRLILDIDGEFEARKSSGGGNHLFFNTVMTKAQHDDVMRALLAAGVIQKAWASSAIASPLGATLRPPWVSKRQGDRTLRQQVSFGGF